MGLQDPKGLEERIMSLGTYSSALVEREPTPIMPSKTKMPSPHPLHSFQAAIIILSFPLHFSTFPKQPSKVSLPQCWTKDKETLWKGHQGNMTAHNKSFSISVQKAEGSQRGKKVCGSQNSPKPFGLPGPYLPHSSSFLLISYNIFLHPLFVPCGCQ
jgi:hypothetical protein